MRSLIQSYWNFGSTYCSIELTSIFGKDQVYIVTAKKKKTEFKDFNFFELEGISKLSQTLSKNQHCYLTINTDKVLIKQTDTVEDRQKMISQAFPGISPSQFYVEIIKQANVSFVCLCRKDYVDQVLKEVSDQKLEVIGFGLGFGVLSNIVPLLKEEKLHSSRFDFDISNNEIVSFNELDSQNEIVYQIDDTPVVSKYLISISGLFNYVAENVNSIKCYAEVNTALKKLHGQKVFFRKGLGIGLGVLFISLVINLFLLTSYSKEKQTLEQQVLLLEGQKEKFASKSLEIQQKETIVNSIINSGNSKSSFYINRIVAKMPNSILLTEAKYQPLLRTIRPDRAIEYEKNTIVLNGETVEKEAFSLWIQQLEQLPWTEGVSVLSYGDNGRNISSFSININLTDEPKE